MVRAGLGFDGLTNTNILLLRVPLLLLLDLVHLIPQNPVLILKLSRLHRCSGGSFKSTGVSEICSQGLFMKGDDAYADFLCLCHLVFALYTVLLCLILTVERPWTALSPTLPTPTPESSSFLHKNIAQASMMRSPPPVSNLRLANPESNRKRNCIVALRNAEPSREPYTLHKYQ